MTSTDRKLREQLTSSALTGILSNHEYILHLKRKHPHHTPQSIVAAIAVSYADAVIERLKKARGP